MRTLLISALLAVVGCGEITAEQISDAGVDGTGGAAVVGEGGAGGMGRDAGRDVERADTSVDVGTGVGGATGQGGSGGAGGAGGSCGATCTPTSCNTCSVDCKPVAIPGCGVG